MSPKVSIIIPVYNGAKTLRRCLESVLSQSWGELEVLCINDGSTDGTASVLLEMASADQRVRLYGFEKNQGLVLAVKMGLLEASGDYVMFVDADDILLAGAIENAVRLIEQYGVDVLQFNVKANVLPGVGMDNDIWQSHLTSKDLKSEGVNILYDCFAFQRFPHVVWNKIYRRDVCRNAAAAMPDLKLSQVADVLQTFFFLYYAKTFRSVATEPYYEYFVGNGISTQAPTASQFEKICLASEILPAIEEFLRDRHEYASHRFLVESIGTLLKSNVLSKLLKLPEITAETIKLAEEHWGSDLIYEFIRETGLLDVPCETRRGIVTKLAEENRKLRSEKTTITISNTKGI